MKSYELLKTYSQWKEDLLKLGESPFPGMTKKEKADFVSRFETETGKRLRYIFITKGINLYHGAKIINFERHNMALAPDCKASR